MDATAVRSRRELKFRVDEEFTISKINYPNLDAGEFKTVHDEIGDLLEQLRRLQDIQVTIDVRFIPVTDDFFERIGVDFELFNPDVTADAPRFSDTNRTFVQKDIDTSGLADDAFPSLRDRFVYARPRSHLTEDPLNLEIRPSFVEDGTAIGLEVMTGYFFLENESTFNIVGGGASGRVGDSQTFNQLIGFQPVQIGQQIVNQPLFQQQTFTQGSFVEEADIVGFGFTQFFGYHVGLGTNWRYLDGDIRGAWEGDFHVIGRLPIETPHFGIAPYFVAGVGGFFGEENHPIGSVGGGLEFRPGSQVGFFAEAKQTWTDQEDMDYTSVVGGIRIVTGGSGVRRSKTKVVVPDGGSVLLGGIARLNGGRSSGRVPVLNRIPYLSSHFNQDEYQEYTPSLQLMVTPRIVIEEE